jgi:hypothetical protein
VFPRRDLLEEHDTHGAGSPSGKNVVFTVRASDTDVLCSGRDWQARRQDWSEWPTLA